LISKNLENSASKKSYLIDSPYVKNFVNNGHTISENVYSSYGQDKKQKNKSIKLKISRFERENFDDRGLNTDNSKGRLSS
jgi:hypothetical protein